MRKRRLHLSATDPRPSSVCFLPGRFFPETHRLLSVWLAVSTHFGIVVEGLKRDFGLTSALKASGELANAQVIDLFGRRYIPRSSPPAVNLTCFSCAICACAWWCRTVAFTIVLRLFISHNGQDDTTGFLPSQPNIWYAGETLGTIYGG